MDCFLSVICRPIVIIFVKLLLGALFFIIFMTGKETNSGDGVGLNIPISTPQNVAQVVDATDFGITFTDANENAFFTVGEVTVTSLDEGEKVMEGTFSFTATNDSDPTDIRVISNGSFRVIYL